MFNIGASELLLILVIAFVVVGPKDLPKVARALGRMVKKVSSFTKELKKETGFSEVEKELKGVSADLKSVSSQVTGSIKQADIGSDLRKELTDIQKEAGSAVKLAKEQAASATKPDAVKASQATKKTTEKSSRSETDGKTQQDLHGAAEQQAAPAAEAK